MKFGKWLKEKEEKVIKISDSSSPEKMRVVKQGSSYLVQTYSVKMKKWITQKTYKREMDATHDMDTWYN